MSSFIRILLVVCICWSCSSDEQEPTMVTPTERRTTIPDPAFEQALIDLGIDNELDGTVLTSRLEGETTLLLADKNISNLTGIADFVDLENIRASNNPITTVDVSRNTTLLFIKLENTPLSSINVSNLTALEKLELGGSALQNIDLSNNAKLQLFDADNTSLSSLDVSQNPELFTLDVRNTALNCIQVSDDQLENTPLNWTIDDTTTLNTTCN
ncbi:MAG: hypothetical protein ABNH00_07975 [Dokdonia sp.]|nr:hypothetical protein [Cytophagaceae bacterium]